MTVYLMTSMLTQERVVADGAGLSEGVELVEPFPRDVELQQAGLFQVGQRHHLLAFPHRLFAALSETQTQRGGERWREKDR